MHYVPIMHAFCLFVFFNHTKFSFSPSTAPEKENEVRTQTIHCTDQAPKSRADNYLEFLYENSFGREFSWDLKGSHGRDQAIKKEGIFV